MKRILLALLLIGLGAVSAGAQTMCAPIEGGGDENRTIGLPSGQLLLLGPRGCATVPLAADRTWLRLRGFTDSASIGAPPASVYDNHADLLVGLGTQPAAVSQSGYYAAGDGGWATYDWNPASTATADGVFILAAGTGRYIMRVPAEGIHPEAAGAHCDTPLGGSVTDDDTAAIQNLANYIANQSASTFGAGSIVFQTAKKTNTTCVINSAILTVPSGVKLKCPGVPFRQRDGVNINFSPALQVNPAYKIKFSTSSGIEGCLIWRTGLAPIAATQEAMFAYITGTLCDNNGWTAAGGCTSGTSVGLDVEGGQSVTIRDTEVIGFNKCLYAASNPAKLTVDHLLGDCANIFEMTGAGDNSHISWLKSNNFYGRGFDGELSVYAATVPSGGGGGSYQNGDVLTVPSGQAGSCVTPATLTATVSGGVVTAYTVADTGNCNIANIPETFGLNGSTLPIVWNAGAGGTNGTSVPLALISGSAIATASGSFTTSSGKTVAVVSCPAASAGTAIYDETASIQVGHFASCAANSITLQESNPTHVSSGAADVLAVGPCQTTPVLLGTIAGNVLTAITGVQTAGACLPTARPANFENLSGGGLTSAQVNGAWVTNANGVLINQDYFTKNGVALTGGHGSGAQALVSMIDDGYRPGIGAYIHDDASGSFFSDFEFESSQIGIKTSNLGFDQFNNLEGEGYYGQWDIPAVGLQLSGAFTAVSFSQLMFEGLSTAYLLDNTTGVTLSHVDIGYGAGATNVSNYQGIITGSGSSGTIVAPGVAAGFTGAPPAIQIGSGSKSWRIEAVTDTLGSGLTPFSYWIGVAPSASPPMSSQLAPAMEGSMVVNGDFRIDQCNEGASNTGCGPNASLRADQWRYVPGGTGQGAADITSQTFSNFGPPNASNSLKLINSVAVASPGGAAAAVLQQIIEAPALAQLGWGTVGAQPVVFAAALDCLNAGTYNFSLQNSGAAVSYVVPIAVVAGWNTFSTVVNGPTTGSWSTAAQNTGVILNFDVNATAAAITSSVNQWIAGAFYSSTGSYEMGQQAGAPYCYLGYVHIRPGPFERPYVMPHYSTEIRQAQRHFQKSLPPGTAVGQNKGAAGALTFPTPIAGAWSSPVTFGQPLEGTPAVALYNPSVANGNCRDVTAAADLGAASAVNASATGFMLSCATAGTPSIGDTYEVQWSADAGK